jgi:radical SAM superfamily enzyme YgiQ (UPF0313 family)
LMNVLIISANNTASPMPVMPLGACMVAESARRAGHNVRFLDLMFENNPSAAVQKEIERNPPDVIGLSVRNIDNNDMPVPTAYYKDTLRITQSIRAVSRAPLIIGGAAVGIMTEAYLRLTGADGAVAGPGEHIFPIVLAGLENGVEPVNIPGLVTLQNEVMEEYESCAPSSGGSCYPVDFKRWLKIGAYNSRLASIPIQTKRGCPFRCVYCTYAMCEGDQLAITSPEDVINHIKYLSEQGFKDMEFVDAVFNYPYSHAISICEGLIKAGIDVRFQTYNLNPKYIDTELLDAMEKAGFCGIGVSAESGSGNVLKGLRKNYSVEQLSRAAEAVAGSGLPCFWMFILGGPGETEETVEETFGFAERYVKPKDVVFMSQGLRIYPGTGLETLARAEGVLKVFPEQMLEPVTYISPLVSPEFLAERIEIAVRKNMNYISSGTMQAPLLKYISPLMHFSGLGMPMWKHTHLFRQSLRLVGANI